MAVERKEGDSTYPTLKSLYQFFSPRSAKLTIWCFGLGYGGMESDFVDGTGSVVNIFDARPKSQENFAILRRVLETHSRNDEDPSWTVSLPNKYIDPTKLVLSSIIPWSFDGNIMVDSVNTACVKISTEDIPRVDICKIDYPGLTYHIVYMILTTGYRPGIMYIRWDEHPDENVSAMLCAGHLQTAGYELMMESGGVFLYRYIDECIYDTCSWSRTDCKNPMVAELTSK